MIIILISDLQTSLENEKNVAQSESSFIISTVENISDLLNNGKITKIAMVIVDNGHVIKKESENSSISKILRLFDTTKNDLSFRKETANETLDSENSLLTKCLQSRFVVFTDNFLGATQSNDQLNTIEEEFDRLKSIYSGNKVMIFLLFLMLYFC